MAVIPTFEAEGRSTDASQSYLSGVNTGSSIMERAQASQRAQAQLEMQQQQFEIQKPVMMAQAQAQIAAQGAQLAGTKRLADLRTEFSNTSPQIMQEFQDAMDSGHTDAAR